MVLTEATRDVELVVRDAGELGHAKFNMLLLLGMLLFTRTYSVLPLTIILLE